MLMTEDECRHEEIAKEVIAQRPVELNAASPVNYEKLCHVCAIVWSAPPITLILWRIESRLLRLRVLLVILVPSVRSGFELMLLKVL
jgi:hypothetical protein